VCATDAVQQKQWFAEAGAIPKELACHRSWDTRTGSRSPQRGVDNPHTEHFVTFTLHATRPRIDDDRRATHWWVHAEPHAVARPTRSGTPDRTRTSTTSRDATLLGGTLTSRLRVVWHCAAGLMSVSPECGTTHDAMVGFAL
jgi:hypothetical protein